MVAPVGMYSQAWVQEQHARIERAALDAALQRPEGQRLVELAERFSASSRLPANDPLRAGLDHFLRRRLRDPMLARSAGGLIEHLKVASGARKGRPVFDMRKDTSPNHAETIVLGFEALVHLERIGTPKRELSNLASLLHPEQSGFRRTKDDATLIREIANEAVNALAWASR